MSDIQGNAYCKNCGIEFQCEVDNPLCLCDKCYEEYENSDKGE